MRVVREVAGEGRRPGYVHPGWAERLPWLVQGITGGDGPGAGDLRLFGSPAEGDVLGRWRALRRATGCPRAVHARQVHGAGVLRHGDGPAGLLLADEGDGHVTAAAGVLLTVSVADCVPVFLVDPGRRAVALLHAGWRGVAAGILEAGIDALAEAGSSPAELRGHLGPSICGSCYEVGPGVHEALGLPVPGRPRPADLREILVRRAREAGVPEASLSVSGHCTLCGDLPLFSHRGGDGGRQVAFLGIAPGSGPPAG